MSPGTVLTDSFIDTRSVPPSRPTPKPPGWLGCFFPSVATLSLMPYYHRFRRFQWKGSKQVASLKATRTQKSASANNIPRYSILLPLLSGNRGAAEEPRPHPSRDGVFLWLFTETCGIVKPTCEFDSHRSFALLRMTTKQNACHPERSEGSVCFVSETLSVPAAPVHLPRRGRLRTNRRGPSGPAPDHPADSGPR